VNTSRKQFEGVFSEQARERIHELVDLDEQAIPESSSPQAVAESLRGAEVVLSTWGARPYTKELLSVCPELELILYGAGTIKKQVTPELVELGPTFCNAAHLNAIPTAEFSLMLILAALKDFALFREQLRSRGPDGWRKDHFSFRGGYYRTVVSILGLGAVSRHLIRLLQNFDLTLLLADDFATERDARELGVELVSVDEAMRRADVVTIHHADVERNWGLVNRRTLSLMKDGARLVNTSRGRMIDEDALVEALEHGRMTAYLDVTYPEPPPAGHPFYSLPNCVLTPHIAGSLGNEVHRMGDYCVRELEHWLAGEPLEHTVDLTELEFRA
jgi:phosphoglycerate dehydrogenase-like enzyme